MIHEATSTFEPIVSAAAYWRDLLMRVRYRMASPHASQLLKRNQELHNRHADRKRCFVVGNGPSLKNQDLKPLKDEVTIVANSFVQHPDHALISPQYYCVGDPAFVADDPNCIAWLRQIEQRLPKTNLFFLTVGESLFRRHSLFKSHNVYYVDRVYLARHERHVRIDFTRPLNVGHSTGSSMAIPLALYLGFREIYLIGFDANWLGSLNQSSVHFYDTNPHYPQFDKPLVAGETMEENIRTTLAEFKSHRLLYNKALLMGSKIFNATSGGWLDMYPRVRYEDLFGGDRQS